MYQRAGWALVAAITLVAAVVLVWGNAETARASGPAFLTAHLGQNCTVQLRRNLLGAASDKPISPTVAASPGIAEYAVSGKLSTVHDEWVVIEGQNRKFYIPQETILLIEIQNQ
jgi:hypothetical protein